MFSGVGTHNAVDTCGNAGAKADALTSGGAPGYVATDRPLTCAVAER